MTVKIMFRDFWGGYKAESNWFTIQLTKYDYDYVYMCYLELYHLF